MSTFTEAYNEALASAPADRILINTIEVYHPSFVTPANTPTGARFVRDNFPFRGKLEATASVEADAVVRFEPLMFDFTRPGSSGNELPYIQISIDNTSNILTRWADLAGRDPNPTRVIYRPYLFYPESDLTDGDVRVGGVDNNNVRYPDLNPPVRMTVSNIVLERQKLTFNARPVDMINKKFPGEVFLKSRFPAMIA
jgi:hypothetical protein